MAPGQLGRLFENLVEDAYTAGSAGRLASYLPVLDSHGVDRAVSLEGGPPLFLQVKAHERARRDGRLSYHIPLTEIGAYERWLACLVAGTESELAEVYLVPGPDLLRLGERGTLVDGRPCVRATLSPNSPTWSPYHTPPAQLAARVEQLASSSREHQMSSPREAGGGRRGAIQTSLAERSQEEGAYFEEALIATILGATDQLALYRPAVDFEGRDLLVQRAGAPSYLFVQVKGTEREDRPGLARFQVRRRTYRPDPGLAYLFAYRPPGGDVAAAWLVGAEELGRLCAQGDEEDLSFEAHIEGPDPRWAGRRTTLAGVTPRLLELLG